MAALHFTTLFVVGAWLVSSQALGCPGCRLIHQGSITVTLFLSSFQASIVRHLSIISLWGALQPSMYVNQHFPINLFVFSRL